MTSPSSSFRFRLSPTDELAVMVVSGDTADELEIVAGRRSSEPEPRTLALTLFVCVCRDGRWSNQARTR
eukprot:10961531-Karenia_brevis.AAC.1